LKEKEEIIGLSIFLIVLERRGLLNFWEKILIIGVIPN